MSSPSSHYDFDALGGGVSRVVCFSDTEGGAPFKPDDSNAIGGALTFKNGLPSDLANDAALVFLGDAQDNGGSSLRTLIALCALKERHPGHVILIMGNRDANKIRLADESLIAIRRDSRFRASSPYNTMQEYADDMWDACNRGALEFAFDDDALKAGMEHARWLFVVEKTGSGETKVTPFPADPKTRMSFVFDKTMGAAGGVARLYDELVQLKLMRDTDDDGYKNLTVALLCMILSHDKTVVPRDMEPYAGLYLRYLKNAHACATFVLGGRTSFASHGGLPHASSLFSDSLGFKLKPPVSPPTTPADRLSTVVRALNDEVSQKLGRLTTAPGQSLVMNSGTKTLKPTTWRQQFPIVKRLILMSGPCVSHEGYDCTMSPIVAFQNPHGIRREADYWSGGDDQGDSVLRTLPSLHFDWNSEPSQPPQPPQPSQQREDRRIAFNLFGHQPRGMAPSVLASGEKGYEDKTWHVCMDVSKVDGNAQRTKDLQTGSWRAVSNTMAMLVIQRKLEDSFVVGRFDLSVPGKNTVLGEKDKMAVGDVRYKMKISELDALQKDHGSAVRLLDDSGCSTTLVRHKMFPEFENRFFVGEDETKLPGTLEECKSAPWAHPTGGAASRRRMESRRGTSRLYRR